MFMMGANKWHYFPIIRWIRDEGVWCGVPDGPSGTVEDRRHYWGKLRICRLVELGFQDADIGQVAIMNVEIQSIADDEHVFDFEADKIGRDVFGGL